MSCKPLACVDARYMMCMDKEDLYERAAWDGAEGTSRRRLLEILQSRS